MSKKKIGWAALEDTDQESVTQPDPMPQLTTKDGKDYIDGIEIIHQHTFDTVTIWDYHSKHGVIDYAVAMEVMCSGCLERKSLEEET